MLGVKCVGIYMNIFRVLVLLAIFHSATSNSLSYDPLLGAVPESIYIEMQKRDCKPIQGYHSSERSSVPLTPFIETSAATKYRIKNAVVFVCESNKPNGKYKIVSAYNSDYGISLSEFDMCDSEILVDYKPGGLSGIELTSGHMEKDISIVFDETMDLVGTRWTCKSGKWKSEAIH